MPVLGPVKVSRSGIYHLPGDPFYNQTKAKHCFATGRAAEAAGYRASKRY
jgi:methylphosphotriester-DNA--protein-cysteine methyltransferase